MWEVEVRNAECGIIPLAFSPKPSGFGAGEVQRKFGSFSGFEERLNTETQRTPRKSCSVANGREILSL
jgi:hypothetical protein